MAKKRKCTGICKNGRPCTAWAGHQSNPPKCWRHKGAKKKVGAPKGNKNAQTHGGYSGGPLPIDIGARIIALNDQLQHVENYISTHRDDLSPEEYIKFAALQGQLLSRLSRLNRERDKAHGVADEMQTDMDAVLKVLSKAFNVDLVDSSK